MSKTQIEGWKSVLKLGRFLFWYALAAAALLVLLPWVGRELQSLYEALSSTSRLLSITGFLAAVLAWQILSMRG
jgi:hypothetical protein